VISLSFDEENNPKIEVDNCSGHVIDVDTVIFAIGQQPEIPPGFELDTDPRNLIVTDSFSCGTSREGVFAAGDVVSGTSSVIKAIASGRKTAVAIDRFLGGNGLIEEKLVDIKVPEPLIGCREGFASMERSEEPLKPADARIKDFGRVVEDIDEEIAVFESERCLQCDLRMKIERVKFWGEY
jgi:NADPH-dependent glutamate synthase beta subunit-like oxidoreductase